MNTNDMSKLGHEEIQSPFGGKAKFVQSLSTKLIADMYARKCSVDVTGCFAERTDIDLYQCEATGLRFWRPVCIAGNDEFYRTVSDNWPNYYNETRWEYRLAKAVLKGLKSVLEVGCGRGYFLRTIEGTVEKAVGLDLNPSAIDSKVTSWPILNLTMEELGDHFDKFDAICAFHLLEHLPEPGQFLDAALRCLKKDGLLIISTPNGEYQPLVNQEDAFDLPPHHMGHYTESTFRRIAAAYKLHVMKIALQDRPHLPEPINERTARNTYYKLARLVSTVSYRLAYKIASEPGPNMLVVLRKGGDE